uniref:Cytochrome P450 n=1 Tax=Strongyloides papillosus TaxID=174720 RepID=A0A0N5C1Q8_STREA
MTALTFIHYKKTQFQTITLLILFLLVFFGLTFKVIEVFKFLNVKIILCIGISIGYLYHELYWKRKNLPPGPVPWLVAGNMPQLLLSMNNIDKKFSQWKDEYGGQYTVWMGPIPMVFVSDIDTMKYYFIKHGDHFSDRWLNYITDTFMEGFNGVLQIHGDKWREQRRFSLHVLRDFGVGRTEIERRVMFEVEKMIEVLEIDSGSNALDLHSYFAACVGNIIITILFGKRYDHDDPSFIELRDLLEKQTQIVVQPIMGLYCISPLSTKIPFLNSKWIEIMTIKKKLFNFIDEQINEHISNFDPSSEPTDFTYAYLKEMHERKSSNSDIGYFSEKQLRSLLLDLFFAGMETTVTTLKWGFLYLLRHPEELQKVQKELSELPNIIKMNDRNNLPYLQAMTNEIQRTANILTFNLLRTTSTDVLIDGYYFKKGTMVLPMISIVMNDSRYFENPQQFNPSRFLDDKGNQKKLDGFMPFSLGKRQCLGESLAKAELYLVLANLLRNFDIKPDPNNTNPSTKRMLGITCSPQKYKLLISKRN